MCSDEKKSKEKKINPLFAAVLLKLTLCWTSHMLGGGGQSVPVPFVMSRLVLSVDFLLYFSA